MATAFDPTKPSYLENPYPALARLRRRDPVWWWPQFNSWLVTSHELCAAVLNDAPTFRADPIHIQGPDHLRAEEARRRQMLLGGANRLVSTDPPDHTRLREVVGGAFAFRSLDELRPAIGEQVGSILDRLQKGKPFDLMVELAKPLPLMVIAEQLGVAAADRKTVIGGAQQVLAALNPVNDQAAFNRGRQALIEIALYLDRVAKGEAEVVGGEVLARMVEAHQDQKLSSAEIVAMTVDLATAGNQALEMAIGNSVHSLLTNQDQLDVLRADPSRARDAIDELLRFETPTQALPFFAARNVVLGDKAISGGQKIFVMAGAANRDPEVFPGPDELDVTRAARRHLAFGTGIHGCLGSALARRELDVVLTELVTRFDELRLRGRGVTYDSGFMHRGIARLPIVAR